MVSLMRNNKTEGNIPPLARQHVTFCLGARKSIFFTNNLEDLKPLFYNLMLKDVLPVQHMNVPVHEPAADF